jgi:flagellar export protein FliJ
MERRRIRALRLIERLKRHEIESDAQEMGRLRAAANQIDRQRAQLMDDVESSAGAEDPAAMQYFGSYLRAVRAEVTRLDHDRAQLEPALEAVETRVSTAFRQMKTYEVVRLTTEARIKADALREEEAAMADVALVAWWRKRRARLR